MDSVVFPELPTYLFEPSLYGVLSTLLTVVLPLLAALLMRSTWSAFRKGLVLLGLVVGLGLFFFVVVVVRGAMEASWLVQGR